MMLAPLLSETEVRALRDRVFENPTTDKNWEACKEKWMMPDAMIWLVQQAERQASLASGQEVAL